MIIEREKKQACSGCGALRSRRREGNGARAGKFNWNIYKFNSIILMGRAAAPLNSKGVRVHGVVRGGGGSSIEMKNTYNRWGNER